MKKNIDLKYMLLEKRAAKGAASIGIRLAKGIGGFINPISAFKNYYTPGGLATMGGLFAAERLNNEFEKGLADYSREQLQDGLNGKKHGVIRTYGELLGRAPAAIGKAVIGSGLEYADGFIANPIDWSLGFVPSIYNVAAWAPSAASGRDLYWEDYNKLPTQIFRPSWYMGMWKDPEEKPEYSYPDSSEYPQQ